VQVCPVGIDIRDGLQYECIACGLCIDACNNVMDKLELPRGLIRYDTAINQEKRQAHSSGPGFWEHILRPRTYYYVAIMALVSSIMMYSLLTRSPLELHVLHDRNPLFVKLSDGSIRNGYDIRILNKTHEDRYYRLSLTGLEKASIQMQGAGKINPSNLRVFADSIGHFRLFVTANKQDEKRHPLTFRIEDNATQELDEVESVFVSKK
jgi:cytochrome c oxidase accessory protein FixG